MSFINGLAQEGTAWIAKTTILRDGKRKIGQKKFSLGSSEENKKSAMEWLHNWERIRSGLSGSHYQPTTLGELVEIYLEGVQKDVKPITLDGYSRHLSPVLSFFGPSHSLFLNQFDIDQYAENRQADGAGRVIIGELNQLRYALNWVHCPINWAVPRRLHRVPKRHSHVPTVEEFKKLSHNLSPKCRLTALLAVLAGLRDAEVYRVEWGHYDAEHSLLSIPAEIRKTQLGNVVPVVGSLTTALDPPNTAGAIIPFSKSVISAELSRTSRNLGIPGWSGLQPCRRLLVTLAEDAGWGSDQIALVTGHSRQHMTSRYSAPHERIELKRRILEDVEQRLVA